MFVYLAILVLSIESQMTLEFNMDLKHPVLIIINLN